MRLLWEGRSRFLCVTFSLIQCHGHTKENNYRLPYSVLYLSGKTYKKTHGFLDKYHELRRKKKKQRKNKKRKSTRHQPKNIKTRQEEQLTPEIDSFSLKISCITLTCRHFLLFIFIVAPSLFHGTQGNLQNVWKAMRNWTFWSELRSRSWLQDRI